MAKAHLHQSQPAPTSDNFMHSILPPLTQESIPEPIATSDDREPSGQVSEPSGQDLLDYDVYKVSVDHEYEFNKKTGEKDRVSIFTKEKKMGRTRIMRSQAETLNEQSINSLTRYYEVAMVTPAIQ